MIRVALPYHLRTLARVEGEVALALDGRVTQRALLDALEQQHPVLRGTIRDQATGRRRPFLRFFAGGEDRSFDQPDALLPDRVASGEEPYRIIGAISGG
jgi:sulfur-carrier protein